MKKLNRQSLIYTLSAVFLWSTVAVVFKISLEGMNFAQLLFYSSFASTIALGVFVLKQKKSSNLFTFNSALLGFINPFLYYIILFKAYSLLPAQEAQPLNYTWPIVLSLFSVLFLNEKMNFKKVVGLISAFIGITIIATHGNILALKFDNLTGVILAVSTSLVWATFWILNLKDKRSSVVKLFSAFFFGTIFSGIYLFLFDSFKLENYNYLFGATYVGLFEMGITFLLWNKGLELSNDKTKTSTFAYLSPFISLVFIAIILGEVIMLSSILGLVFIVGGIVYQNLNA
ncbi:MAG: DMT family transporter [Melioribacteraceae bacterium]|jgi:drug/metabolite transporter (DMT)-like permease|nr:DMT family transporter [Melioribacteraceae bacterium]